MEDIEFSKIYEMEFVYVYKYILSICCNKELAEEITQQTFFRALEKYKDFRGECQIRTWLCQIAKNEYYKQNKKNKGFPEIKPLRVRMEHISRAAAFQMLHHA